MNHAAYYHNKVIWITGASSGIGAELALQLAKADAKLVLSARDVLKLNELKSQLKNPEQHLILPLDLSQLNDVNSYTDQILAKYGRIELTQV